MSKSVQTFIIVLILVVAVGAGIFLAKRTSSNKAQKTATETNTETNTDSAAEEDSTDQTPAVETDLIFFYGSTCPHCKVVEEFFNANKVTRMVKFEQKEVYGNEDNAKMMTEKQTLCKNLSDDNKGGVPFLYGDNGNICLVGSDQIINYFKKQFSI